MKKLIINSKKHGQHTILYDDEDHELISKYTWHLNKIKSGKYIYAVHNLPRDKNGKQKSIKIHRLIMRFPVNKKVDHRNSNGLDNRKINIRVATTSQNAMNRDGNYKNKFKGVYWHKLHKKYIASIGINAKLKFLGYFDTAKQAAIAYNNAALIYHGEFARLNPIPV
jgi:hypothetical protein